MILHLMLDLLPKAGYCSINVIFYPKSSQLNAQYNNIYEV